MERQILVSIPDYQFNRDMKKRGLFGYAVYALLIAAVLLTIAGLIVLLLEVFTVGWSWLTSNIIFN